MAIAGQIAAVVVADRLLGIDLRLDFCAFAIAASVGFNIVAIVSQPTSKRLSETGMIFTLLFDLSQLTVLLYLTGGLSNPFSLLVLAPVTVSATVLTLSATILVSASAITAMSLLIFFYVPLHTHEGTIIEPPAILVTGMWASLVIGIAFLASYARRVSVETFSMSQALSATQMALSREQRLTALGGVVAAAAHELGTPLATIKLVSSELEQELSENPDLVEDVRLIRSQTERCRDILRDMGRSGRDDALLHHAPVSAIVAEAAEPHVDRGKAVIIFENGCQSTGDSSDQPLVPRHPEIIHGLRNLVQNAVDFAGSSVWINIGWDETTIRISIKDDGVGFPVDILGRIGDPFVRQRNRGRSGGAQRPDYEGMGLGLFIAKTLLERTGARLFFSNGKIMSLETNGELAEVTPKKTNGALVEVSWARSALESDNDPTRSPLGRNQLNLP